MAFVTIFSGYMIFRVAPTHGTKNPMVYLSICSLVGSVSIMAIKVSCRICHLQWKLTYCRALGWRSSSLSLATTS